MLYQQIAQLKDVDRCVALLLLDGFSYKEIAARLTVSVKTVDAHKVNAMRKLDLNGRIDIVRYAVLQGWLHDA